MVVLHSLLTVLQRAMLNSLCAKRDGALGAVLHSLLTMLQRAVLNSLLTVLQPGSEANGRRKASCGPAWHILPLWREATRQPCTAPLPVLTSLCTAPLLVLDSLRRLCDQQSI